MTRRQLFGSLCSMVLLVNLGRVVFAPLLEPLRAAFGLGPGPAGLVVTAVWAGSALPRLPVGYLLTRVARHRVVAGAGALLAAAAAFTAAATSYPHLLVGSLLVGLTSGAYFIAANPLVSELFPDRVGRALGIHGTAAQLAAVGAPLFVGAVLVVGEAVGVGGWRLAFVGLSAAALAATGAFVVLARRASLPGAGRADRNLAAAVRRQWPLVASAVAIVGATGFVWNGVFNFYVTYLVVAKGLPEPTGRALLTVVFAAGVPAFWATGSLADRVPRVPLLLTILGGFAACLVALPAAGGIPALVVVSAALGYAAHSLYPAVDTYLLDSLPDAHRASAYSAYSAAMMLAQAPGGWAVGRLVGAGHPFDAVFRQFGAGLAAVLAVLVVLHLTGRLPAGGRPAGS